MIVTGGGTGIGYVIASSFLKSGANVVVVGRRNNILDTSVKNLKSEIPNAEGRIIALSYDLSKDTCVDKMFNEALKQFKKIDILINSCGTWKIKPIIELSNIEIEEQYNNLFKTTVLCTKHAAKNLKRGGVIINIGSFAGLMPIRNSSIYSSLKSAVSTFTKSSASELGKEGIRVNCIVPGVIRTPMTSKYIDGNYNELIKPIALGRFGSCSDISNSVLFLASDLASYITGCILEVTGGKYISQL